jgi:hypothetical protein
MARCLSLWFYELELFDNEIPTTLESFVTNGRGFGDNGNCCCREN